MGGSGQTRTRLPDSGSGDAYGDGRRPPRASRSLVTVVGVVVLLIAAIADGIRQVLTNPSVQKELVEKGYQRVKQLTWQQTAQQCLQIFQEIF